MDFGRFSSILMPAASSGWSTVTGMLAAGRPVVSGVVLVGPVGGCFMAGARFSDRTAWHKRFRVKTRTEISVVRRRGRIIP